MGPFILAVALLVPGAVDAQTHIPIANVAVTVNRDAATGLIDVEADAADGRHASFHGSFQPDRIPAIIQLSRVSADEARALDQLNRFRSQYGMKPLAIDENLTETARYWALEERRAGRIGHTCAALGTPPGCIEFNEYFHRLPGAPQDWFSGQNAAFEPIATSWSAPDSGFENERFQISSERGHFQNIVSADRWIGFGEANDPDYGSYFAMNIL